MKSVKGNIHGGQIHELAKVCFEDSVGKVLNLPRSVTPRFDPPRQFHVSRVEFERPIPFAGYNGRRPDVVLTSEDGLKLLIEIKNTNGKSAQYGWDMSDAGFWLVLELDVSNWKSHPELRPDFSSAEMLQQVMDQTYWLSAGKPRSIEWRSYTLRYRDYVPHGEYSDESLFEESQVQDFVSIPEGCKFLTWNAKEEVIWMLTATDDNEIFQEYTIRELNSNQYQAMQWDIWEPPFEHRGFMSFLPPAVEYPGGFDKTDFKRSAYWDRRMFPEGWIESDSLEVKPYGLIENWLGKILNNWNVAVEDSFRQASPEASPIYDRQIPSIN